MMHKLGFPIELKSWHFAAQEKEEKDAWMSAFLLPPVEHFGYTFHDADMAREVLVRPNRGDS